ncbi:DinB family protein [Streptomyces hydrogenans]|uniref:DinB family protein n=1 Tax=Streptomyces hydrogenans TaxID=1873719 RepID=UPI0037F50BC7
MAIPARLAPLLAQFDFARQRLTDRLAGPVVNSGNGTDVPVGPMTDAEYLWEPGPGCWSVRRQEGWTEEGGTLLSGAGEWGRETAPYPHPVPPPFTTLAWRLTHLSELLALRADHTVGTRSLTRDDYRAAGDAASAIAAFDADAEAWRGALLSVGDKELDTVGHCTYPHGGDAEEPFLEVVWWVNQELLHHGAEIALLRDLYRIRNA